MRLLSLANVLLLLFLVHACWLWWEVLQVSRLWALGGAMVLLGLLLVIAWKYEGGPR